MPSFRKLLRAFQYRNYRLFFAGQSVALTGGWMTLAALGWLIFRLTGDPLLLGLMGFFLHAPTFFLSPFGGVLVDRVSRRKVIVLCQIADSVTITTLAILTLTDIVAVWHVMSACVLLGITKAFEMPARMALVVDIVDDRNDLSNAIALNSTTFHGARLVGPMFAGVLIIPYFGEGVCFLVHAATYMFAIRCFTRLRPRPMQPDPNRGSVYQQIAEGARFAFGYPPVRALMLLVMVLVTLGISHGTLLPVFAETILSGDSGTYGLLLASGGLGAVVAAIILASRESVLGLGRVIHISAIIFGASLLLFANSTHLALSLLLLFIAGLASINVMVGTNTIIQTLVDDRLRGRVMSLLGMVFMGAIPLGALLQGRLATLIGAPGSVSAGAIGCVIAGLIFGMRLRAISQIARPLLVKRGILPDTSGNRAGTFLSPDEGYRTLH